MVRNEKGEVMTAAQFHCVNLEEPCFEKGLAQCDFCEWEVKKSCTNLDPWHPMTDLVDIKHIGKLQEELHELGAAIARCLIQGIDGVEPVTKKSNRLWLEEEIADVYANLSLVEERFGLKMMYERIETKQDKLSKWHRMA